MELLKKIARPPAWIGYPLMAASFGLILYVAITGRTDTVLAYASYGLSAYALILLCFRLPGIIRFWITALSGAAIFITVLSLAIYMLFLARDELNKMKGTIQHGTSK